MHEEKNIEDIIDRLLKTAEDDGRVTEEEYQLLENLEREVLNYQKSVYMAEQDNFISDDEFHELVIARDSILNKAMDFHSDSEDLIKIIQQLFEEINNLVIPGMQDEELPDK